MDDLLVQKLRTNYGRVFQEVDDQLHRKLAEDETIKTMYLDALFPSENYTTGDRPTSVALADIPLQGTVAPTATEGSTATGGATATEGSTATGGSVGISSLVNLESVMGALSLDKEFLQTQFRLLLQTRESFEELQDVLERKYDIKQAVAWVITICFVIMLVFTIRTMIEEVRKWTTGGQFQLRDRMRFAANGFAAIAILLMGIIYFFMETEAYKGGGGNGGKVDLPPVYDEMDKTMRDFLTNMKNAAINAAPDSRGTDGRLTKEEIKSKTSDYLVSLVGEPILGATPSDPGFGIQEAKTALRLIIRDYMRHGLHKKNTQNGFMEMSTKVNDLFTEYKYLMKSPARDMERVSLSTKAKNERLVQLFLGSTQNKVLLDLFQCNNGVTISDNVPSPFTASLIEAETWKSNPIWLLQWYVVQEDFETWFRTYRESRVEDYVYNDVTDEARVFQFLQNCLDYMWPTNGKKTFSLSNFTQALQSALRKKKIEKQEDSEWEDFPWGTVAKNAQSMVDLADRIRKKQRFAEHLSKNNMNGFVEYQTFYERYAVNTEIYKARTEEAHLLLTTYLHDNDFSKEHRRSQRRYWLTVLTVVTIVVSTALYLGYYLTDPAYVQASRNALAFYFGQTGDVNYRRAVDNLNNDIGEHLKKTAAICGWMVSMAVLFYYVYTWDVNSTYGYVVADYNTMELVRILEKIRQKQIELSKFIAEMRANVSAINGEEVSAEDVQAEDDSLETDIGGAGTCQFVSQRETQGVPLPGSHEIVSARSGGIALSYQETSTSSTDPQIVTTHALWGSPDTLFQIVASATDASVYTIRVVHCDREERYVAVHPNRTSTNQSPLTTSTTPYMWKIVYVNDLFHSQGFSIRDAGLDGGLEGAYLALDERNALTMSSSSSGSCAEVFYQLPTGNYIGTSPTIESYPLGEFILVSPNQRYRIEVNENSEGELQYTWKDRVRGLEREMTNMVVSGNSIVEKVNDTTISFPALYYQLGNDGNLHIYETAANVASGENNGSMVLYSFPPDELVVSFQAASTLSISPDSCIHFEFPGVSDAAPQSVQITTNGNFTHDTNDLFNTNQHFVLEAHPRYQSQGVYAIKSKSQSKYIMNDNGGQTSSDTPVYWFFEKHPSEDTYIIHRKNVIGNVMIGRPTSMANNEVAPITIQDLSFHVRNGSASELTITFTKPVGAQITELALRITYAPTTGLHTIHAVNSVTGTTVNEVSKEVRLYHQVVEDEAGTSSSQCVMVSRTGSSIGYVNGITPETGFTTSATVFAWGYEPMVQENFTCSSPESLAHETMELYYLYGEAIQIFDRCNFIRNRGDTLPFPIASVMVNGVLLVLSIVVVMYSVRKVFHIRKNAPRIRELQRRVQEKLAEKKMATFANDGDEEEKKKDARMTGGDPDDMYGGDPDDMYGGVDMKRLLKAGAGMKKIGTGIKKIGTGANKNLQRVGAGMKNAGTGMKNAGTGMKNAVVGMKNTAKDIKAKFANREDVSKTEVQNNKVESSGVSIQENPTVDTSTSTTTSQPPVVIEGVKEKTTSQSPFDIKGAKEKTNVLDTLESRSLIPSRPTVTNPLKSLFSRSRNDVVDGVPMGTMGRGTPGATGGEQMPFFDPKNSQVLPNIPVRSDDFYMSSEEQYYTKLMLLASMMGGSVFLTYSIFKSTYRYTETLAKGSLFGQSCT